jgi:Domain of unknown function (DUF4350)
MTGTRRPVLIGLAVVVALVVVALVAGQNTSGDGAPLSPSSTAPDGLRGLVLLLESFDATVQTDATVPDAGTRVAFVARDGLDDRAREDVRSWVRGGGTLIVADPESPLAAESSGEVGGIALVRGQCDLAELDDVDRIEIGGLDSGNLSVFGGVRYDVNGEPSCFGDGETAYVIESPFGSGAIISVGGPNLFANGFLDESDNSVLAMRLLQRDGPEPVAILASSAPGAGRTTLLDLVPDRVFQAFIQLGIAFLLYALWRARRLGRPVVEPQPVAIAGSQLVRAVGSLQQRTGAAERAGAALRHDLGRLVRERYGLTADAPTATVAQVVADRTGLDRNRVAAAFGDTPVLDDHALVALTHELDTIREEILDGR